MAIESKKLCRRIALGSLPVLGLLLCIPVSKGQAQISVFDAMLSTVAGMAGSLTAMQQVRTLQSQFEQTVVWPSSIVSRYHSEFGATSTSTQSWLSQPAFGPTYTASPALASSALELLTLSAHRSPVSTSYAQTYGPELAPSQAPPLVTQSVDMTDASAKDSLELGMSADSTTSGFVSQAQQIQTSAASAAPGVQSMLTAQAMASQLQCLAQQHKLYASMLREEAAHLGEMGMEYKQSAIGSQNVHQGIQNVTSGATRP